MRRIGCLLLLLCAPALGQVRVEPILPRLSPAPTAIVAPSVLVPAPLIAPAPAPTLSAAPALAAAPAPIAAAAAEGPSDPAKNALSAAGRAAAPKDDAGVPPRSLNVFWDGVGSASTLDEPVFAPAAVESEAAGLSSGRSAPAAPWLELRNKRYAAKLDAAVRLARSTRSGRKAFAAAERALDGAALPVDVLDLGRNWGEFDYLDGRLRLDEKLFAEGREAELAGTIAHELMRVAQHAQGLPSNALELELEAHLLDLAMLDELGLKTRPRTFARQAQEALATSPQAFIELISAAVPGSPFLGEQDMDEIVDQLEQDYAELSRKKKPRLVRLAAVVAEDLQNLRAKRGRAAYREFSKRVLAELARRSSAARK